ncbi:type VI secretion system-associated FHA domain protein TagH, partial [Ramlibacter sp.]|uniref:type VI secretion system-associated FHA domain protein TagH n=1 Tax=Ramlibacter sp. TaxID=1917967 RepID=UPI002D5FA410
PANPGSLIDEFLGAPGSTGSGLGASSLLRPSPMEQAPRLAVDHVHDFNLPVSPVILQPAPVPAAAPVDLDPLAALAASQSPQQAPAPAASRDPWADLPSEWLTPPATPAPEPHPPLEAEHPHPAPSVAPSVHDDPFSSSTSWRVDLGDGSIDPFSHSFVGDPSADAFAAPPPARVEATSPPATAGRAGPAADEALAALCKGLGLGASRPQQLSAREWEAMGASVRMIVQGLTELMNVRAELKKELRAVDRTMLGAQENNPLKTGMEAEELLHYLLFMPAGAAGYMPVKAALEEAIGDLRGHEFASVAAVRAAVEGAIREFDPQKLRAALLKGKKSIALVDNARLWDLYTTFYEKKGEHMADWLEQMFNRHFMPTYSRETERLRRERVQAAEVQPRRH